MQNATKICGDVVGKWHQAQRLIARNFFGTYPQALDRQSAALYKSETADPAHNQIDRL